MFPLMLLKNKSGFTLLEVLIAFALLATLLTVIIQSQAETAFFLEKTGKQQLVQRVVMNELSKAERGCGTSMPTAGDGEFSGDHVLAGSHWQREVLEESYFLGMIQVIRISFRVSWENPKSDSDHVFESSILCGRR